MTRKMSKEDSEEDTSAETPHGVAKTPPSEEGDEDEIAKKIIGILQVEGLL